jgi:hypothetical protein
VPALAFLWFYNGVNFLAFKMGVEALPAAFLAATRFTVAGLMMLPVAAWRVRAGERPNGRSLVTAGLLAIIMLVGGQALAIWGVHYLPAGTASVFGSTPPLYLALFTWLFFRQPLARSQLAGGYRLRGNGLAGMEFGCGRRLQPGRRGSDPRRDGVLGRWVVGRSPGQLAARPGRQRDGAAPDRRSVALASVVAEWGEI